MNNPPTRSTFVTVTAWVFIVVSGLASLVSLLQNIVISVMLPADKMQQALSQSHGADEVPAIVQFMLHNIQLLLVGFLLLALLSLTASIGLLRRKNWARIIFIALMGLGILWNIGGVVFNAVFFSSMVPVEAREMDEGFEIVRAIMLGFSVLMALVFSALFGWIMAKLLSKKIRDEFA